MKTIFRILCAAIVVALLAGGAWFLWNRNAANKVNAEMASTATTAAPAPAPATTEAKATVIVVNATPVPTATPALTPAPTATSAPEVDVRKVTEAGSQTQAWHLFVSSVDSAQEWLNSQDWVNLEEKFVAMNNGMNFYQSIKVSEAKADGNYISWWTASRALEDDFALTGEVDVLRADGRFVAIPVATTQKDIRVNHAESVRGIDDGVANGLFVRQDDGRWVLNDSYTSGEVYETSILGKLRVEDGFVQAGRLGDAFGIQKVAEGEYRFVLYIAEAPATVVASNGGGNGGGTKPAPTPTPAHEPEATLPPKGETHSREELAEAPDSDIPPEMGADVEAELPPQMGDSDGAPAHSAPITVPEKGTVTVTATYAPAPTVEPLPPKGSTHSAGDDNAAPNMGGITW